MDEPDKRGTERVHVETQVCFREISAEEFKDLVADPRRTNSAEDLENQPQASGSMYALTENLSVSGLKLVGEPAIFGDRPLLPGTYLEVEIQIPENPYPVRLCGEVVWSKAPVREGDSYSAGLRFRAIDIQDLRKVQQYLSECKRLQK